MDYSDFKHRSPANLPHQLASWLADRGYTLSYNQQNWQIRAENVQSGHSVVLKQAEWRYPKWEMMTMRDEVADDKVIIADFYGADRVPLDLWFSIAATSGVGVYSTYYGWLNLPGENRTDLFDKVLMEALPDIVAEPGQPLKKYCHGCGELLPVTEFYRKAYRAKRMKDPYRSRCKQCYKYQA